jgi:predicted CXXCH cytochrome family protein
MFNSQEDVLLEEGCVNCHTALRGQTGSEGAPIVLHIIEPTGQGAGKTNAGGDFYWVNDNEIANAAKGHNVIDLPGVTGKDVNMPDLNPLGWDKNATSGFRFGQVAGGEDSWSKQLTCAGKYGCHGNHTETSGLRAVSGSHHENTGGTSTRAYIASTIGNSFRFLAGIKGLEDAEWNWSETTASHNEYYGRHNPIDRNIGINYGSRDTISFLCAECHGIFHDTIGINTLGGSLWGRHPTDVALPNYGEYNLYNTSNGLTKGNYSLEAPVARSTVPISSQATVTPGSDIVMCLSCHRAHGSNQDDLLRWNYKDMMLGSSHKSGCFVCHNGKNKYGANP